MLEQARLRQLTISLSLVAAVVAWATRLVVLAAVLVVLE
tara:strand:- start:808 stop:924 length:117 start_codon:yes stop_codon:yes gene_type:complete